MEENAADEGEAEAEPGVLQCVDLLELEWLVDGDVPVDCDADDDVHRVDEEQIGQGQLHMSLSQGMMVNEIDQMITW